MRRRFPALLVAALLGGALLAVAGTAGTGGLGGTPAPAAFRLADGSVACNYLASASIACRAAATDATLVLEPSGAVRVADVRVSWDNATPVLKPSASWWHGIFTCRVEDNRVVCATLDGGEIRVGADAYGALTPPALHAEPR